MRLVASHTSYDRCHSEPFVKHSSKWFVGAHYRAQAEGLRIGSLKNLGLWGPRGLDVEG